MNAITLYAHRSQHFDERVAHAVARESDPVDTLDRPVEVDADQRLGRHASVDQFVVNVVVLGGLLQAHLAAATPGPYGRDALTLEVYGRNGQMCSRCADSIDVTRTDGDARLLYWCPGCQTRMDRRLLDDTPVTLDREPDPR